MLAAIALEQVDGGNQRAAGRQHRVDDHGDALVQVADKLFEVRHRLQGFFVTRQAYHADLGRRHQVKHAVQHADTGAQDRHHGHFLAFDLLHVDGAAPAIDGNGFQLEITGGFISQQARQLLGQQAEFHGADIALAQQAEFVLYQRVIDYGDVHALPKPWQKAAAPGWCPCKPLFLIRKTGRQAAAGSLNWYGATLYKQTAVCSHALYAGFSLFCAANCARSNGMAGTTCWPYL